MFYVNNNCKLDFKLGHVTHLITMFQPLLLLFVQNFKFLLMAYKVIRDLTPTDDFLEFISHRCDLCSLATATPAFCLILKHFQIHSYLLFPLSGMWFTSNLHDWPLLAIQISSHMSPSLNTLCKMSLSPNKFLLHHFVLFSYSLYVPLFITCSPDLNINFMRAQTMPI